MKKKKIQRTVPYIKDDVKDENVPRSDSLEYIILEYNNYLTWLGWMVAMVKERQVS